MKTDEIKVKVTVDDTQAQAAIETANELVDAIKKAKYIALDLAHIMDDLKFEPKISEIPEDD